MVGSGVVGSGVEEVMPASLVAAAPLPLDQGVGCDDTVSLTLAGSSFASGAGAAAGVGVAGDCPSATSRGAVRSLKQYRHLMASSWIISAQ
ncbi:MAG: hypothetical protein ACM3OO_11735 [Planctomycetaceae bacterium]